jgi:pimeloyl-ACP methyl ester carboxylesterase
MQRQLIFQNKKIFYEVKGNGKPVILIHGFGEDSDVWKNQIEELQKDFQLIIPDLPGSGQSELIDDMSIEGMADAVKAIADVELTPNFSLIGHSMGGYITLAFAEKYPELLNAFGLFHSTAYADTDEKKAVRRKGIEFIQKNGAKAFLETSIPNLFSDLSKVEMPEIIDEFIRRQHNFSAEALVLYYEAMINRPDRTPVLRNSTVPVLFIMGKYDKAIPLGDCLKQCHMPRKSYIHIHYRSGHMGMLEEPNKSTLAMKHFLMDATNQL